MRQEERPDAKGLGGRAGEKVKDSRERVARMLQQEPETISDIFEDPFEAVTEPIYVLG